MVRGVVREVVREGVKGRGTHAKHSQLGSLGFS